MQKYSDSGFNCGRSVCCPLTVDSPDMFTEFGVAALEANNYLSALLLDIRSLTIALSQDATSIRSEVYDMHSEMKLTDTGLSLLVGSISAGY